MICPVDKNGMIAIRYEDIELDYCTDCRGVWFDSGELELLLEAARLENSGLEWDTILDLPEAETVEKKRRCPVCGRHMKKANIGQPPVLIDACGQGHGLWFDGGEVGRLTSNLGTKPGEALQGRVIDFIGELFKADHD